MNAIRTLAVSMTALCIAASPAHAAQNQASEIPSTAGSDEIIVTAQRRAESVQDTPLSIAAIGGEGLRESGVTDIATLGNRLPNVNINTVMGVVRVTVRGIGNTASQSNAESQLAYNVDGVYIGRPEATGDTFFDVERMEVVRGPQGTLYGRNATGGAINLITRDPTDELSGYANVTLGTFSLAQVEGAVGGPLADGLSIRLAVQSIDRSGYGRDGNGKDVDNQHSRAIRGKLKIEPAPDVSVVLGAEYYHQDDTSGALHYANPGDMTGAVNRAFLIGGTPAKDRYHDTNGEFPGKFKKDNWAVTGTLNWDIADAATLTSISSYRKTDLFLTDDYDDTQVPLAFYAQNTKSKQFSQEARLGGTVGKFSYVLGGYYYHDDVFFRARVVRNRRVFAPDLSSQYYKSFYQYGGLKTSAYAAFGQIGFEITDQFGIDVGGRYSIEKKNRYSDAVGNPQPASLPYPTAPGAPGYAGLLDPANFYNTALGPFDPANVPAVNAAPQAKATFKKFTPKVTLRYKPNADILAYLTYSVGFRSGGFSLGAGGPPFLPETLKDYEGGIKADLFGGNLRANLSAFYYDYTNLQVTKINPAGGSNIIESAGTAEIYGTELSLQLFPREDFQLNADVGYVHSQYKVFSSTDSNRPGLGVIDLSGNQLAQSPKWTANVGAENTWHPAIGDVTLRGEARYTSKVYFTPFNTDAYAQDSFVMFDAFLNYTHSDNHLTGGIFVKNITNKHAWTALTGFPVSVGAYAAGTAYAPRTAGVRIGYQF